ATGSSLVLFVRDTSAGANPNRVYARDLGLLVDNVHLAPVASDPYTGPVQQFNYTLPTIGPDSNLTAFLAGGTSFVWTIMAADTQGTAAFNQRYVTTTQNTLAVDTDVPINSALRGAWSAIGAMFNDLNGALPDSPGSSTSVDGLWGQTGSLYENMTS